MRKSKKASLNNYKKLSTQSNNAILSWNRLSYLVLFVIVVLGAWKYFYSQEALENYATTIGKVTWLGRTPGKRVGQPELKCSYRISGNEISKTFERKDLEIELGDCLEIKYSVEDNDITTINYDRGPVPCID